MKMDVKPTQSLGTDGGPAYDRHAHKAPEVAIVAHPQKPIGHLSKCAEFRAEKGIKENHA
jgi:hypothetical protein